MDLKLHTKERIVKNNTDMKSNGYEWIKNKFGMEIEELILINQKMKLK